MPNPPAKLNRLGSTDTQQEANPHIPIPQAVAAADSASVVAKPVPLDRITPDARQPRRAIPLQYRVLAARMGGGIETALTAWIDDVQHTLGEQRITFNSLDVIRAAGFTDLPDDAPNSVIELIDLLTLAGTIQRDGLMNPISVYVSPADPDRYTIEAGERRFLAHVLLRMLFNPTAYTKIPARIVPAGSLWRQAAENGNRRPLNAIGMARQLALLIMDMYPGEQWQPYESLLTEISDRPFYAQVADGRTWHIQREQSERVMQVTGLKSRPQIAQYRALLSIPDEVWIQADAESWTEGRIRYAMNPPKNEGEVFTVVNTSPDTHPSSLTPNSFPAPSPAAGFNPPTPQGASPVQPPSPGYRPPGSFQAQVNTPPVQPLADPRTKPLDEFYPRPSSLAPNSLPLNRVAENGLSPAKIWSDVPFNQHPRAHTAMILMHMLLGYAYLDPGSPEGRQIQWMHTVFSRFSPAELAAHVADGYSRQQFRDQYLAVYDLVPTIMETLDAAMKAYAEHIDSVLAAIEGETEDV